MYTPHVGDIIKMHAWHGIVLEKFQSEAGHTILKVHTVRNVFRKLGPELIDLSNVPDNAISLATQKDLEKEIQLHRTIQQDAIQELLNYQNSK